MSLFSFLKGRPPDPVPDWGDSPSMSELTSEERKGEVPPDLMVNTRFHKDHSGIFVGRTSVIKELEELFDLDKLTVLPENTPADQAFAALVTNAPGAGKSTLLTEFSQREEEKDRGCPRIAASALATKEDFLAALQGTRLFGLGQIASVAAANDINLMNPNRSELVEKLSKMVGPKVASLLHGKTAKAVFEPALRFYNNWMSNRPQDVAEALRHIAAAWPRGFILIVDEAQQLGDFQEAPSLHYHLEMLCDPGLRHGCGIQTGGLLMAGLGSAPAVLDDLNLSRVRKIWLPPLDIDEATERLEKAVLSTRLPSNAQDELRNTWVPHLRDRFHHWTHHVECAADGLSKMALRTASHLSGNAVPEEPTPETALDWAVTFAATEVVKLYASRSNSAKEGLGNTGILYLTALANLTDNNVPELAVTYAIQEAVNQNPKLMEHPQPVTRGLRRMLRSGLMEPVQEETRSTKKSATGRKEAEWATHYRFGLPSLRRYITETTDPADLHDAYDVARKCLDKSGGW